MKKIFVKDLPQYYHQEISFQGFVDNIRNLQYVIFMVLRDGSGKVQVTIEKNEENQKLVEIVENICLESTVLVTGTLLENAKVKMGGKEIIPTCIEVTSLSCNELPIDIKNKDNALRETRLDYRFLDLRREENYLFFKCETLIEQAMREYWTSHDFMEIHSPKISAKAAESGAEVFKFDYFGEEACLSQSPQFY